MTARWCLENSKTGQALSLFDKASVSSATQTQYLQFIVETLTDAGVNGGSGKVFEKISSRRFRKKSVHDFQVFIEE